MAQETSITAYLHLIETGKIGRLQQKVMEAYLKSPNSTDKEISEKYDININVVTARRFELVEMGFMTEQGKRPCTITGSLAIYWKVRTPHEIQSGKPLTLYSLKDSEMQAIQKKIHKANSHQKQTIINWCQ